MDLTTGDRAIACPVAQGFDPLAPDARARLHEHLATLRTDGPVWYLPSVDHYLVTRYDDIVEALGDRETWSAANASATFHKPCAAAQAVLDEGYKRIPTLNNTDPPRHGHMRRALRDCMSSRRQLDMEADLRRYARALIEGVQGDAVFDLIERVAFPFPGYAAFTLLGFPEEDTERLKQWSHGRVMLTYGKLDEQGQVAAARDVVDMWRYAEDHVAKRQAAPADDVTSDLLAYAATHGDVVTPFDVVNMVYSLALAGHETTCNAIGNAVHALMTHRDQWDRLIADPSLCANAADEALRYDGPVISQRRLATSAATVQGHALPSGAKAMLCFASAARDPAHFDDPDAFLVDRPNASQHLAFGKGAHFCLGAPLARLEIRIALELLTELMPDLHLASDDAIDHVPNILFRGPRQLLMNPGPLEDVRTTNRAS